MPKKKYEEGEVSTAPLPDWVGQLPPDVIDGKPNPAYYRAQLNALNLANLEGLRNGKPLPGYDSHQRGIIEAARLAGLDTKRIGDTRTEMEKAEDAVVKIMDREILALTESEIGALEILMDQGESRVQDAIRELRAKPGAVASSTEAQRWQDIKKGWRSILSRLKVLRKRAMLALPRKISPSESADQELIFRAAHVLRFMAYVGRPDNDLRQEAGTGVADDERLTFMFGRHHGHMALAYYLARNRMELSDGIHASVIPGYHYEGLIIVMAPGHGKSSYGIHTVLLEVALDPKLQCLITHAQAPKAQAIKGKIGSFLDEATSGGRKFLALFPLKLADTDNNKSYMRLESDDYSKSPTIGAHGVRTKVSGDDAGFLWLDDPCDQEIMEQEGQREVVDDRINGTWMQRLRGTRTFYLITATIWHQDDPVNRRIMQSESQSKMQGKNKQVACKVLRMTCGGPSEDFRPLWPEVYPASYLKRRWTQMRNPGLYSAQYRCDPVAPEARVIRKLRFYDPKSVEHQEFIRTAVRRLSLDPTATDNADSDHAGVVNLACGDIKTETQIDGGTETIMEQRVRLTDAKQIRATQTDLKDEVLEYARHLKVDYLHIETRGAFAGLAEMFEQIGIFPIRHDPTNVPKKVRLRAAASAIEDGYVTSGIRACFEMPGVSNESGELVCDPDYQWLASQILDFGFTGADHGVDAITQVIIYLTKTEQLMVGTTGTVSQVAMRHDDSKAARMKQVLKAIREESGSSHGQSSQPAEMDDLKFLMGQ